MTGSRTDGEALAREAIAHVDTLHRLARRLTGDERDAEDLVQETYAKAFAALDRFEPGTDSAAGLTLRGGRSGTSTIDAPRPCGTSSARTW